MPRHVLDNRDATVADYLNARLPGAARFSVVSAYFSVYGYELLADALDRVGRTRFLFGDPSSVDDLTPGDAEAKGFQLTERGLAPQQALTQKALAQRCEAWVKQRTVGVRSMRRANFLHGKMYLTPDAGVVGSSNFTKRGLGGAAQSNLEINLAVGKDEALDELQAWFDDLWADDKQTHDVKQQVLDALNRLGRDHAPELLYFKTLYEVLWERLAALDDSDARMGERELTKSVVWNTLYAFQQDGVRNILGRLRQHSGCILADSVGLGKTYTALAVIKHYELGNENVLVLCPAKLRENWALYPAANAQMGNPFAEDRFRYTLLAHTDLSRDGGMSGGVDLANFNWSAFDLVVIDESHNFRNDGGQRYRRLMDEVVKRGGRTKVLMLSATPVNTSLIDLRNQVRLMTEEDDSYFRESLGVGHVGNVMAAAQKQFKAWEQEKQGQAGADKAVLLERLGADFQRLLDGVTIARSRRQITQFYAAEMARIGKFPTHAPPANFHPPTDLRGDLSYERLAEQIGRFSLSIYRPSDYLIDRERQLALDAQTAPRNFTQPDRERFLVGMIRVNFLKRLESSPHALRLTLERTIGKIDELLAKIDAYEARPRAADALADDLPDEDEEDDNFVVNRARRPYRMSQLDLARWRADIARDRAALDAVRERVAAVTPERDGKLLQLRETLRERAANPVTDLDGAANRKLLVFTTFKDTAVYLYEQLEGEANDLGLRMAMVSGDATRDTAPSGAAGFHAILDAFAPAARTGRAPRDGDVDLLIATDCISEGQNLQDCAAVLNYDIHWNPVRLIQRFGRIDRIGSRHARVAMLNYWPTEDMEKYLNLENRVLARMALVDAAGSGSDDPFAQDDAEEGVQMELNFRDKQLLRLREEVLDLDDLSDGLVLSDLSLDYFLAQLRNFLKSKEEELKTLPLGAYALARAQRAGADPGVLFLLRQRNADKPAPGQRTASPIAPHYLVYIKDDGSIRFGCANPRQSLHVFEAAAVGETAPIRELCDAFDRETQHGREMAPYNALVKSALAHVQQSIAGALAAGLSAGSDPGFTLPKASETPKHAEDFELVTWLILR